MLKYLYYIVYLDVLDLSIMIHTKFYIFQPGNKFPLLCKWRLFCFGMLMRRGMLHSDLSGRFPYEILMERCETLVKRLWNAYGTALAFDWPL